MTVNFSQAVAAYTRVADKAVAGATDAGPPSAGQNFSDLLARTVDDTIGAGRAAESAGVQAIANNADLNDIVTAVTNAEVTLQTVVAIRDRVIQAYQDIIRMPI